MTGFGRDSVEVAGVTYGVEVRSVNHRYLDVRTRLPRVFIAAEPAVRSRVAARVSRGRVEVVVQSPGGENPPPTDVVVNLELARAVHGAHRRIADALGVPEGVSAHVLAQWPGVVEPVVTPADEAELLDALLPALDRALDGLIRMRDNEGAALATELSRRLDSVDALRKHIQVLVPEQGRAYRERLEARLREMLADLEMKVEEGRVLHEVGVFAERADVAEELARLDSHLDQARALLVAEDAVVGRRLDFLCQEMFREANTVGSKAQLLRISELSIELKAELERLREQVQNVE